MDKWEYVTVVVGWNQKSQQWESEGPTGSPVKSSSVAAAFQLYGDEGWEAVGFVVLDYDSTKVGDAGNRNYSFVTQWAATSYRVLFKRRKS